MMMTEKQALSKYCVQCFTKPSAAGFDTCRGSECMAWRWALPEWPRKAQYSAQSDENMTEPTRPAALPESWEWYNYWEDGEGCGWIEPEEEANTRRVGYCGLVGRPT